MDDDLFDIDPYSDYQIFGTKEVKHGDKWLWKDGVKYRIYQKDNKE